MRPVPERLKCTICTLIARDAFKLTCCESSICTDCKEKLSENCPVCDQSNPVVIGATSLRVTINAWLKAEEKREQLTKKASEKITLLKNTEIAENSEKKNGDGHDPSIPTDLSSAEVIMPEKQTNTNNGPILSEKNSLEPSEIRSSGTVTQAQSANGSNLVPDTSYQHNGNNNNSLSEMNRMDQNAYYYDPNMWYYQQMMSGMGGYQYGMPMEMMNGYNYEHPQQQHYQNFMQQPHHQQHYQQYLMNSNYNQSSANNNHNNFNHKNSYGIVSNNTYQSGHMNNNTKQSTDHQMNQNQHVRNEDQVLGNQSQRQNETSEVEDSKHILSEVLVKAPRGPAAILKESVGHSQITPSGNSSKVTGNEGSKGNSGTKEAFEIHDQTDSSDKIALYRGEEKVGGHFSRRLAKDDLDNGRNDEKLIPHINTIKEDVNIVHKNGYLTSSNSDNNHNESGHKNFRTSPKPKSIPTGPAAYGNVSSHSASMSTKSMNSTLLKAPPPTGPKIMNSNRRRYDVRAQSRSTSPYRRRSREQKSRRREEDDKSSHRNRNRYRNYSRDKSDRDRRRRRRSYSRSISRSTSRSLTRSPVRSRRRSEREKDRSSYKRRNSESENSYIDAIEREREAERFRS